MAASCLANVITYDKDIVKDCKIGIENCKYGPVGEDLFAEMCMKKNGVTGTDVFDFTKNGHLH